MKADIAAMSYAAMRAAWCRREIVAFLRRWAAYAAVIVMLIGAGTVGAPDVVMGVCALLVLPLALAIDSPAWLLPALLAHAAAGGLLLAGARTLLWPRTWREAEAALPIPPAARIGSDAIVCIVALLPWALPGLIGAARIAADDRSSAAVIGLVFASGAGSVLIGIAMLAAMRHAQPGARAGRVQSAAAATGALQAPTRDARVPVIGWFRVLCVAPLVRCPARRSGRLALVGTLALVVAAGSALAGVIEPLQRMDAAKRFDLTGCALALYSAAALLVITRLNRLMRDETAALLEACHPLPLAVTAISASLRTITLAPMLLTLPAMLAAALLHTPPLLLRTGVGIAWALACAAACTAEVWTDRKVPADKSARWLFSLLVMCALAFEVAR
jgi:hypothetical protein